MTKSSLQQIIKDEQKILDILQKNANESIDAIAKKCGFSRQKVWRIVKKLEKDKTIWGYTAICDDEPLHLKQFTMLVKRTTLPLDKKVLSEILNARLENISPDDFVQIENIEYVHGLFDWMVTFRADSLITAKRYCERFKEHYSGQIAKIDLLESILTVRKQTLRNPRIKEQIKFI
jgi:DNA-binding Lrp family transcriptional regulator